MSGLRVLVCGGRRFSDRELLFATLDALSPRPDTLLHGHAIGADSLADEWARARGVAILGFRAQWEKYGKAAGPRRNQRMLDTGRPRVVIAFPGGVGTADMVRRARAAGIEVREILSSHDRETDHER